MPKTLSSPVSLWPGTVVLPDWLTYLQYCAWDDALAECLETAPDSTFGQIASDPQLMRHMEPALFAVVSVWEIPALETFVGRRQLPATPRAEAAQFALWLIDEVYQLVRGAALVPNG